MEMDVSIASPPPTVDEDVEPRSLISPPRSHQACFVTREVKLSDCGRGYFLSRPFVHLLLIG